MTPEEGKLKSKMILQADIAQLEGFIVEWQNKLEKMKKELHDLEVGADGKKEELQETVSGNGPI